MRRFGRGSRRWQSCYYQASVRTEKKGIAVGICLMERPNGLRVSCRPCESDIHRSGTQSSKNARSRSPDRAVGCTQPSRRGVTPHQRNPLIAHRTTHLLPWTSRPAVETGHRTGADEPPLHPGSHAPVTPPLVAVATSRGRPRSPRYVRQVLGLVALSLIAVL